MYTPVNPSFTLQKWGLRGSIFYRRVFMMLFRDRSCEIAPRDLDFKCISEKYGSCMKSTIVT